MTCLFAGAQGSAAVALASHAFTFAVVLLLHSMVVFAGTLENVGVSMSVILMIWLQVLERLRSLVTVSVAVH